MAWHSFLISVKSFCYYLLRNVLFETHAVADLPFKISTKYTMHLIFLLMCASATIEINCKGADPSIPEMANINDHCLNVGTFLVQKALQPNMSMKVQYPGVSQYVKQLDPVIRQIYYKQIHVIYAVLVALAIVPYLLWQVILHLYVS